MWVMLRLINTGSLLEDFTGKQKWGLDPSLKFSSSIQGTFGKGMPSTTPMSPSGPHHLIPSPLLSGPPTVAISEGSTTPPTSVHRLFMTMGGAGHENF